MCPLACSLGVTTQYKYGYTWVLAFPSALAGQYGAYVVKEILDRPAGPNSLDRCAMQNFQEQQPENYRGGQHAIISRAAPAADEIACHQR